MTSARRVLIDVSRLIDPRLTQTGIARYGRELLRHLPLVSDDQVWAVVQEPPSKCDVSNGAAISELHALVEGRLISVEAQDSFADALSILGPLSACDVFHSIHLPLPPPRLTCSASRILTVHDVLHLRRPDLYGATGVPPIQRSINSLTQGDIVLCDSDHTRADLQMVTEHPSNQMVTVPLGCKVAPTIASAASRHDITCLVQSAPRKHGHAVLTSLTQVLADRQRMGGPPVVGHVFTPNVRAGMVHNAISAARINPSLINVVVNAEDEVIRNALARSRAFLWGSEYEGFGLPVLEAMAHGTVPVLAPNSSHIAVAGDSGAYAPAPDSKSLTEILHRVLNDAVYAEQLSKRAVQRARMHSWRKTAERTVRAYASASRLKVDQASTSRRASDRFAHCETGGRSEQRAY